MRWMRLGARSVTLMRGAVLMGAVLMGLGAARAAALAQAPGHGVSRPSFDCHKARTLDERAICASPELMRLDRQLDVFYHTIAGCVGMGSRADLIDNQRRWLAKRAQCGGNGACLGQLYRKRIALFAPYAVKAKRIAQREECPGAETPPLD
ncbi:MAG: hypothetical protein KGJ57_08465 [Sphingomonadales bacterium]|nr:hypothetical protein [Sphingomonadales bacterium]MDE2169444.1 hypothetical protein [Sphingomonadales bacterium]